MNEANEMHPDDPGSSRRPTVVVFTGGDPMGPEIVPRLSHDGYVIAADSDCTPRSP
jgi:hypothetical protein